MRRAAIFIPVPFIRVILLGIAAAAPLAGCASSAARPGSVTGGASAPVPQRWHAPLPAAAEPDASSTDVPLPHAGQIEDLSRWWAQFDDPLMLALIDAGQQVSPTIAQASARIADARAARIEQRATLMPAVNGTVESSRGRQAFGGVGPVSSATMSSAGVQASWEVDLFGANRAGANAARARLESSEAGWHDARVSVAAEVATAYLDLRACEAQVRHAELDAESRAQTSRLTSLSVNAGFQAPAAAEQATATAAQGTVALIEQRMHCDLLIKSLTALTARGEEALRHDLAGGTAVLPRPADLRVTTMPAAALAQRPDIYAAARDVMAASADSAQARARRWPRVSLAGNIGTTRIGIGGESVTGSVWSIGPVTVALPLFDGGTRRAHADAARVRYEAATTIYAARLREAIRDVERALVTLDSTAKRRDAAVIAANGFERSYLAVEARYRAGLASLFDLEDARRGMVGAQSAVTGLQHERISAWIALYRALGGGWSCKSCAP